MRACVSAAQLEAALGVFYAPPVPLPDAVVLEYREPIGSYARRFFHHLVRYPCLTHHDYNTSVIPDAC